MLDDDFVEEEEVIITPKPYSIFAMIKQNKQARAN